MMMVAATSPSGGRSTWLKLHEGLHPDAAQARRRPDAEVASGRLGLGLEQAQAQAGLLARLGGVEGVEGLLGRGGQAVAVVVHGQAQLVGALGR